MKLAAAQNIFKDMDFFLPCEEDLNALNWLSNMIMKGNDHICFDIISFHSNWRNI